jgi:hypothetical protein
MVVKTDDFKAEGRRQKAEGRRQEAEVMPYCRGL